MTTSPEYLAGLCERLGVERAVHENGEAVGRCLRNPDGPEAASAIRSLVEDRERLEGVSPDAHAEAVEAFRKWYFEHGGKRIFYRNASKAVDLISAALSGRGGK